MGQMDGASSAATRNKIRGENGKADGQNQIILGQSCIYTEEETMS